jgi:hypothetical protein
MCGALADVRFGCGCKAKLAGPRALVYSAQTMLINETPGRIETSPPSLGEKDGVPFTERRDGGRNPQQEI